MELWIRSQDKRVLTKVNELWVSNQNSIYCNNDWEAGQYASEKRALEVLDEIQNMICPKIMINLGEGTIVYQMPEE